MQIRSQRMYILSMFPGGTGWRSTLGVVYFLHFVLSIKVCTEPDMSDIPLLGSREKNSKRRVVVRN